MGCLHGRLPYSSWRLRVFQQLFLPATSPKPTRTILHRTISSSTEASSPAQTPQSSPESPNTTPSQGDTQKLRPSQLLPQSPVLTRPHPGLAKKRKKRVPTSDDLHDLRRNPWAKALASPPRMCAITGTRVPRDLLGDWGMVQRRNTDEGLWVMPVGLMKDELDFPSPDKKTSGSKADPSQKTEKGGLKTRSFHYLVLRLVDRLPLLRRMTAAMYGHAPGRKISPITRIFPFRWKHPHGPLTSNEEKQVIWREDMPQFVLGQMKRSVVKQLKRASEKHKRMDDPDGVWRAFEMDGRSEASLIEGVKRLGLMERMGSGAVLYLGSSQDVDMAPTASSELSQSVGRTLVSPALPEFVTVSQTDSKVPVFDLTRLLSPADLEELRAIHPRFESPAVFFRPNNSVTVETMLILWKLHGFVKGD